MNVLEVKEEEQKKIKEQSIMKNKNLNMKNFTRRSQKARRRKEKEMEEYKGMIDKKIAKIEGDELKQITLELARFS